MTTTDDWRYEACRSRDARFDGLFFVCVTSTGIFCRPSCPALTPQRKNVLFHRTAAAAQHAGFRACKRCAPDASPGSPEWDARGDLVARAVRLVEDGIIDREGVPGLAQRLGYSERQLRRAVTEELGVGPLDLARARRARTARVLLTTTELTASEVAFAAGFASIRQFNDTLRAVYARTPTQIRDRATRTRDQSTGIDLRLPFRAPLDLAHLLGFLGTRAVPGVESWDGVEYRRVLRLPHGFGALAVHAGDDRSVSCRLHLDDLRDLSTAVSRVRRLLDLDADPHAVDAQLSDSAVLAPLVAARPGLRAPGAVDGAELAIRALLGQQVSVAAARTLAARLTAWHGEQVTTPYPELTHAFPSAEALAAIDPSTLPMPGARAGALVGLSRALADGLELDPGADRDEISARLLALPGIGPWTVGYIRMRALHDPDADLSSDLVVRQFLARHGVQPDPAWRPWRSYATHHLWAASQPAGRMRGSDHALAVGTG
ncbi:MAG: AraC family transcriptional regulator [Frankiaceae bacterium]|nr:AraC family transcriptional regulator [Frankiaceae bacterium]